MVEGESGVHAEQPRACAVLREVGVPASGVEFQGRERDRERGVARSGTRSAQHHPAFDGGGPVAQDQLRAVGERFVNGQPKRQNVGQSYLGINDDNAHYHAPPRRMSYATLRLP
ncbi:hypothetical protein ACFQX6_44780 [Streptosporangium lutulentum]